MNLRFAFGKDGIDVAVPDGRAGGDRGRARLADRL
jgi:hypothetical protein